MLNQISLLSIIIVAGMELIDGKPATQIKESIIIRQLFTHRLSGVFCFMIIFLLGIPISEALVKQKY